MAQAPAFSLDFAAATDIGCHRGNNEDSFGYDADNHLYVVCDGMGGSAAGEVASSMAVRALIECFEFLNQQPSETGEAQPIEGRLLHSIHEANRLVHEEAVSNPEHQNMGTTLVCAALDGSRLVVGNVGDSRCYLIRGGASHQVTLDHSLLDEQLRMGLITPEVAAASNLQSVITRAIGTTETVEPDLFAVDLQPGDMFLLTSDGLTRYARPDDIAQAARPDLELTAICETLIDHAKTRGGVDNITCMMLRAFEASIESEDLPAADPTQEPAGEFTTAGQDQQASQ